MRLTINTNTPAITSKNNLKKSSNKINKSIEQLSSGMKINRAADDSSGLAISEKMKAQITSLKTYIENSENGISLIQTAEGYMSDISDMLQRGVELSERAANGIFTADERKMIQLEIDHLNEEIDRISDTANFNNILLLKGDINVPPKPLPPKITSSLPAWVNIDTNSKDNDILADSYTITDTSGNTTTHSATTLDFSSFTSSDIPISVGKGFYTTCCTCNNHYSFEFTNDTNSKLETSGRHYIFKIGIGDATSADDIYNKIIAATGGDSSNNFTGQPLNHFTKIIKDNNKLVFYDERENQLPNKASGYGLFGEGIAIDAGEVPGHTVIAEVVLNSGPEKPGKIRIPLKEVSTRTLGTWTANVLSVNSAGKSMEIYKDAIDILSSKRATLGALQNRLEYTINNLTTAEENLNAANSRIRDTDMAKELMTMTQFNVLSQSAQAMLAQANNQPQNILQLMQ